MSLRGYGSRNGPQFRVVGVELEDYDGVPWWSYRLACGHLICSFLRADTYPAPKGAKRRKCGTCAARLMGLAVSS